MLRTLGGLALEGSDFRWQKPLLLLAYIALEGRHARREVAELFWPSAADRMKSLSVALAQLRRGAPGVVRADRRDLDVAVELDLDAFRRALEHGDLDAARRTYRGPFLDGFDERHIGTELEAWIYETREREAERLRRALLEAARACSVAGDAARAAALAADAFTLAGAGPVDPAALAEVHGLLAAAGHPLVGEVAKDGAELGLSLDSEGVRPDALAGGAGQAIAGPARAGAAQDSDRLAAPAVPLVGRDEELERVLTLLRDPATRVLTLVGPGGAGKSRLAVELARRPELAPLPVAGPVDLEPVRTPAQLFRAMAASLGMAVSGGEGAERLQRQLVERLRTSPAWIVLDGFEHLSDGGCPGALARVAAAAAESRVLVTSQAALQVADERVFRLAGLAVREGGEVDEGLAPSAAERLFEIHARRAAPDFQAARQQQAVRRCCELLEGLPLGIELAAAWAATLPVSEINEQIRSDPGFLSGHGPAGDGGRRGLRTVFERSWLRLGPEEQHAFASLAVFEGGFALPAATFVAGVDAAVLRQLVRSSLVAFDPGAGRYRVHDLVRAFAGERLEGLGSAEAVRARHAAHYCAWMGARARDLEGAEQRAATDMIERELANVRSAFLHAAAAGAGSLLAPAAPALGRYYQRRGPFAEGADVFAHAASLLEGTGDASCALVATLHAYRAGLLRLKGDVAAAREAVALGRTCLSSSRQPSDAAVLRARARLQRQTGMLALGSDNLGAAQALEQAASDFRVAGLAWEEARSLGGRAHALLRQGRDDEATRALEEALDAATGLRDAAGTADLLATAAWAAALHGRFDDAESFLRTSERAFETAGDLAGTAAGLGRLGMTAVWLGEFEPAKALFEKSLAAHGTIGEWWSLADAHVAVGLGHLHLGAYREADHEARTGLGLARRLANPVAEAHSQWLLGATALTRDEHGIAAARFRSSVGLCRLGGEAHEAIPSVALLAVALRGLGRPTRAWSVLRIALRRSVEAQDFRAVVLALSVLSLLVADGADLTTAATLQSLLSRYAIARNCHFIRDMSKLYLMPLLAPLSPSGWQTAAAQAQALEPWSAAAALATCHDAAAVRARLTAGAMPAAGPAAAERAQWRR